MKKNGVSRRDFMKTTAGVTAAAMIAGREKIFAAGSDKIRIGLVGCGDRGVGAAWDCAKSADGVEIYALADVFQDKIDYALNKFTKEDPDRADSYMGGRLDDDEFNVTPQRCFVGFDAYKKLLALDEIDVVLLATPPGFRPEQLMANIKAGKHAFIEKPAAVDPAGVRLVIKASKLAAKKNLGILAGTQRQHAANYVEIIKRIHNGDIGKIVSGHCYWNGGGGDWHLNERQPGWCDMEWQIRSWPFFVWLSGDFIVEQHVHNLDVMNWAIGTHPVSCMAMGGRQIRVGEKYGNIYDHFATDFEYPNDVRVSSMCRQMKGTHSRVEERVIGTKGWSLVENSIYGDNAYKFNGPNPDAFIQEHADLINSIRAGKPLNEGKRVAESTMCAIMARTSAYTGRAIKWDWIMKASKLDLAPAKFELGDLPVRSVSMPGKTELI